MDHQEEWKPLETDPDKLSASISELAANLSASALEVALMEMSGEESSSPEKHTSKLSQHSINSEKEPHSPTEVMQQGTHRNRTVNGEDASAGTHDMTGITQYTDLEGVSQHTSNPEYTGTTVTQLSLQNSGNSSAKLPSMSATNGSGARESIALTQYTDVTGLSQYTEESSAGLSEYSCSDVTGLTQHTLNTDVSHLTQYSDTTSFQYGTVDTNGSRSAFKPMSRDSTDFEMTASLSERLGLRDSIGSEVSHASSSCRSRQSIDGDDQISKGSRGSVASTSSSKQSEASVGKVIRGAGMKDYMTLEERQMLIGGDFNNHNVAQLPQVTDMRNIQRPSLEGAADDNGKSNDRKLAAGNKAASVTTAGSEISSTDYNQLDLFAHVSDKEERLSHQSDQSSTDWNRVDIFASREQLHQSSRNNSNRSSLDLAAVNQVPFVDGNYKLIPEGGARPKVPSVPLEHRRPDGGESGSESKRSSMDSRSSSRRGSGNGQEFEAENRQSGKGSRSSSRNEVADNVLSRPNSTRGSIGSGRESMGSRSSEGQSRSQRSSLGSRHSDTASRLSVDELSLHAPDSNRESLELSVDPRREMGRTMDSVDADALLSSGSHKSFNPSSIDKDDRQSVSSVSSTRSRGSEGATAGKKPSTSDLPESSLLQDFARDNKQYYSLAMVSTNSSLDVDDFARQADRASTAPSSRDAHGSREQLDLRTELPEPHVGYELYSPSSAAAGDRRDNIVPKASDLLERRLSDCSGRKSSDGGSQISQKSHESGTKSSRSSTESQRSSTASRKSAELAIDTSQTSVQNRSLVLQPKPDLNEIVAENRDSPVSLDNTEELLKESNKHLPDKPLEVGQESDSEIFNCNSFSLDQSEASNGRPSVGSTIRNVVRQSLSERGDPGTTASKTKKNQTNRAKSDGTKSIPDEETDRKSMPDRVAEMLAEVTTPHVGREDVVKYPASDKSDRTLTPDPDVLSCKSGRSGKSSKSSRSGISSVDKSLLDNIADVAGHKRVEEWRTQSFGAPMAGTGTLPAPDGIQTHDKDADEASGGRLTSTGSSTVYADLPPKLGQKVANSSTVKEPTPSGQIRSRSPSSASVNSDDTLDEDVRRILNKYSKVIISTEDESEVNEARKSPQGSSYDTDESLGLRVSHLLNGENIRMQLRNRLPKASSETRSSVDSESLKTEDLLKPVSVNADVNSNDTSKKYSRGAKSGSSSKASTLKEEDFKAGGYEAVNVPMELPVVDPARKRGITPTQQQSAEYPELEGIERMNPALSNNANHWQQREPKSAQEQEITNAGQHQMRDDSLMNALSRLGEGVDPEIMERTARKAFDQQQTTQQEVPVPDREQTPLNQSQLTDRSLDSLSNRVNLLLSETVSIGARQGLGKSTVESSSSSRRSSQTSGSINYDMLQRELDDIQSGLMALQKGDLSIKSLEANEEIANVRRSVDAIQSTLPDRRSRTSDSEFSTPRKYSWDYGADLGADENQGEFISTRRNLTFSADRSAPEGKSAKRDEATPTNSPTKLRSKTPDILVTPASGTTRTSQDGDAESVKSRSSANVTVISDDGRRLIDTQEHGVEAAGRVSEGKPPNVSRTKTSERASRAQPRHPGSNAPKDSFSNKLLDRVLRQDQQRDSGIDEHGRGSLRHQDDSGMGLDSRFSSSYTHSARDSGLGAKSKSCEDLHGKSGSIAAAAAIEELSNISNTRGSETSLTERIADIMERESPQRQALEYLEEAEKSWMDMQRSKSEQSLNMTEDMKHRNNISLLKDKSEVYSPSPVPQGPLSAFGNMRAFLASQLQRTSQANFDTSVELPSPLQRHSATEKHAGAEVEPAELPENTDYRLRTDVTKPPLPPLSQTKSNVNIEKTGTPAQLTGSRDYRLKGDWHKETPDRRKDAENTSVKDSDRADEVSKLFGDSPKSDSNMTMTTNSIVDSHSSRMSEMYDYYKHSSRIERPDQPDRLSFGRYVDSRGLSPIPSDTERPDSAVSSVSRRSGSSPSLRPYKPPGSTEVYYVEAGADDNASITTMESTHADSDDAVGPHFPKHVLGSRTDPAVNSLGIYGNTTKLQLQSAITPSRPLDPIQEANSIAEYARNNNNQKEKKMQDTLDKSETGSQKSSERTPSELCESMNAETVISKHNQSTNNRSISSEEHVRSKNASSHSPSVRSQDVSQLSRDASVKSHDLLQKGTSPGSVESRDASQSLPSSSRTQDTYGNTYVSDHTDSRGTDDSFRPWEKPFGNNVLEARQYHGINTYELRLRIREQEEIQRKIERQKELIRQREEDEIKLRETIQRDLDEEAKMGKYYRHDLEQRSRETSNREPGRSDQLYASGEATRSNREFRTPERHTPEITRSTSRIRSHDQRTESGYYDTSGGTRYDDRQGSSVSRSIDYETNRTRPTRGDTSKGHTSSYSKGTNEDLYSHRRSPYGASNGDVRFKASSGRSSFMVDTGVAGTSDSDRPQSDEFQPLPAEQETDSSPDAPVTSAATQEVPDVPPIPRLPNSYRLKDGTTAGRGQEILHGLNRSAKEPLERSVLESYQHPTDTQTHRLSRSLEIPKQAMRVQSAQDEPNYQSGEVSARHAPQETATAADVRYQRDYELEKLQADIRRRKEEVEQLKLQSLRDDGLPDNINSLWDRFNKLMTGTDSTLSEGSMDESTISSSSVDMDRLKDLLKNPGKYLLSYLRENPQMATSFTVPLEPRPDKKQRNVNFDSDLNERRHYPKDGYIDKMERRKQYERSREQYADTSTTSSQNQSSSEYMDVSSDASSTLTDTTISSNQSNGSFVAPKKRKHVYALNGQDSDTLPSIPEDTTLDSATTDDVTMTTDSESVTGQGHRDPRMIQLQQKIKRQKELHEKERRREFKRKEKIAKLEQLLAEKNKNATRRKSTSPKKTSTPSGVRYSTVLQEPPTPTMSEITSSSTMIGSSTLSDDTLVEELDTRGQFTRPEEDSESSACACNANYKPVLTPKATPLSSKKKSPEKPASMRLREVDYTREETHRGREKQGRSVSDTQQERSAKDRKSRSPAVSEKKKKTASTATSPRQGPHHTSTSVKKVSSPGKPAVKIIKEPSRHEKERKQHSNRQERERTFVHDEEVQYSETRERERSRSAKREKERERERSRSAKRRFRSRSGDRKRANVSTQVQPTSRNVSVNCPSPIVLSPPTRRKKQEVTMVSEAVQTSFHKRDCPRHGTASTVKRQSEKHSAGAFTPETSGLSGENVAPSRRADRAVTGDRSKAKAGQSGFAWYVPLGEPRPWRKPLRERQAYAVAMETGRRHGNYELPLRDEGPDQQVGSEIHPEKSTYGHLNSGPSLQDAFRNKKTSFITRSRERQRIVTLKAMERKMQELHNLERVELFAGDTKRPQTLGYEPHPIVERLFKPKRRVMTKKEMKELNQKVYRRLPEVTEAAVQKRREAEYRTNRVRAQMFKQKVLNRLLYKKAAWVQ